MTIGAQYAVGFHSHRAHIQIVTFKYQLQNLALEMRKRIYFSSEHYKILVSLRRRSLRRKGNRTMCHDPASPARAWTHLPNATHSYLAHCTDMHSTPLHCNVMQSTSACCIPCHCIPPDSNALRCSQGWRGIQQWFKTMLAEFRYSMLTRW